MDFTTLHFIHPTKHPAKKMPKRIGASMQPCLTPLLTPNLADTLPSNCTVLIIPSWKDLTMLRSFGGQPISDSILNRPSLLTILNALVRYKRQDRVAGSVLCTSLAVVKGRISCLQLTSWSGSHTVTQDIFYWQVSAVCVK